MRDSDDNADMLPSKPHLNRSNETTNLHSLTPFASAEQPHSALTYLQPLSLQQQHSRGRSLQPQPASIKSNPSGGVGVSQFIRTASPDDSFGEDNAVTNRTSHRNSSLSNSNGTNSFLSRSGNGRMLSDGNLSPASQKKASDSSFLNSQNISANNANPPVMMIMNSSMTSYSSCSSLTTEIGEISSPLQAVLEYFEKDETMIEHAMYEFLIEELHKASDSSQANSNCNNTLKDYFCRVIQAFQNEEEDSPFFSYASFQEYLIPRKKPTQSLSSVLNPSLSSANMPTTMLNNSSFMEKQQQQQYYVPCSTNQDFEDTQNLRVGSAMSSLVFQLTNQKHFRNTMILTFDYFITPITFLLFIIKSYYIPTPVGMSEKEAQGFEKRVEQIRINISQVIRDYADIRSGEFLQNNLTSMLLIVFLQTVPADSKEKSLFGQLQEKIKAKKTQYELETVQKRNKNQNMMHTIIGNTYPRSGSTSIYQSNGGACADRKSSGRPSSGSSNSNNSSIYISSANIPNTFTQNNGNNSINLNNSQPLPSQALSAQPSMHQQSSTALPQQLSQAPPLEQTHSLQQPQLQVQQSIIANTQSPQSLSYSNSSSSQQYYSYCLSESELRARRKNEQIYRQLALYEPSALILYPVELIAKVMSSIDAKWFLRLNLQSLLNSKINDRQKCPQIQKYTQRFNNLVYWFMNLIVSHKTIDMRANQLAQFIEILQLIDQDYHSYPSMHAIYTVLSYMKMQLPVTWQKLEEKLRIQKKWVTVTLDIQRYSHTFNDKYYGYKQETQKLTSSRTHYIPCMNPYFQDIYSDEAKFSASKKNSQFVIPRLLHERISDRLLTLLALQKTCEKHYPMLEAEAYKDFRNYKLDESQLFALFKKKCIKDIDDILTTKNLRFKDLEVYFIEKCKALEPTQ